MTVAVTTIMTIVVVADKAVAGVEDEAEVMIEIVAADPVDETDLIELRSHWPWTTYQVAAIGVN